MCYSTCMISLAQASKAKIVKYLQGRYSTTTFLVLSQNVLDCSKYRNAPEMNAIEDMSITTSLIPEDDSLWAQSNASH